MVEKMVPSKDLFLRKLSIGIDLVSYQSFPSFLLNDAGDG